MWVNCEIKLITIPDGFSLQPKSCFLFWFRCDNPYIVTNKHEHYLIGTEADDICAAVLWLTVIVYGPPLDSAGRSAIGKN